MEQPSFRRQNGASKLLREELSPCQYSSMAASNCVMVRTSESTTRPSQACASTLSLSLSTYLSIYLSIWFSTYLSIYLSISLSLSLCHLITYLPIYLSIYLSIHLSFYLSIYLAIYLSIYLPIYLSIHPSVFLSVFLSICLCICLSVYLSVYLSVCLPACLAAAWLPGCVAGLRAVMAKAARTSSVLSILTSKRASHHNRVPFFDSSTSKSASNIWLFLAFSLRHVLPADGSTPAVSTPTFRTPRSHKTLEKHSVSRLFYLFAHLDLLSSDFFSSDSFSSLTALTSAIPSVHTVGSLTSKLPSII